MRLLLLLRKCPAVERPPKLAVMVHENSGLSLNCTFDGWWRNQLDWEGVMLACRPCPAILMIKRQMAVSLVANGKAKSDQDADARVKSYPID